ncbi:MAG: hypothetical protein IID16_01695 [Candidatus Marinimicrobia bacterium]|nr:hypothetical protein [Candidatus Neomarinimicrobiota bacterium]
MRKHKPDPIPKSDQLHFNWWVLGVLGLKMKIPCLPYSVGDWQAKNEGGPRGMDIQRGGQVQSSYEELGSLCLR